MRQRPLVGLCVAFAAGILLASFAPFVVAFFAVCSLILLGIGLTRRRPPVLVATCAMLAAWAGAAAYLQAVQIPLDNVSRLPATTMTLVGTVENTVILDDDPRTDELKAARFVLGANSATLASDSDRPARLVSGSIAVRAALVSRISGALLAPHRVPVAGDRVELRGRLELPDGPRNPGAFDYRAYLERRGIHSVFIVRQPEHIRVLAYAWGTNPFTALAFSLRHGVLSACKGALPRPLDGILAGILVGERHRIAQPLQEEFERTGAAHILATAGLHVGMVVCLLAWCLRGAGVGRRPALAAAIGALALFSVMAGDRAAVLRAVIVASYYLFGELVEREPDLTNGLAVAALTILVSGPLELFDPGFQLSFATVVTIVLVMPALSRLLVRRTSRSTAGAGRKQWVEDTRDLLLKGALIAAAAQIGSAPLIAAYFYNMSLVSIAANMLAVPAVFLVILLGFPMTLLFAVHPLMAAPLALLLRALLRELPSARSLGEAGRGRAAGAPLGVGQGRVREPAIRADLHPLLTGGIRLEGGGARSLDAPGSLVLLKAEQRLRDLLQICEAVAARPLLLERTEQLVEVPGLHRASGGPLAQLLRPMSVRRQPTLRGSRRLQPGDEAVEVQGATQRGAAHWSSQVSAWSGQS